MIRIEPGTRVHDVRGRLLGTVGNVYSCCIQLDGHRYIQHSSVFNVTDGGIELVCDANQVVRYSCRIHGAVAAT